MFSCYGLTALLVLVKHIHSMPSSSAVWPMREVMKRNGRTETPKSIETTEQRVAHSDGRQWD